MSTNELHELVKNKIEHLRPKLLDLSRRNPLLSTKLSPRSNAHVRVVDELPDILFYKLNNGQEMRLLPLPDIDDDPKDEESKEFNDALSAARLTDEDYLRDLESVDRDADDYVDRTRKIDRALKDRLRAELSMQPRPKGADLNLAQHARNNGITPSYELPEPKSTGRVSERHSDDSVQTLLLPKDLERKLNLVASKCRTWVQETGINVLQVAYGFLEWSELGQTETSYAPLILCGVQIDKKRTREGVEFSLRGLDDDPEINAVLIEKMRLDFGIELPAFEGTSVEEYMSAIAEIQPRKMVWKIRRQVAIGVFPSARMAMYHDIDPNHETYPDSEIVRSLLGGSNTQTASPFAEEYNVDQPEIEKSVPYVVMDADSSQFSALVDIANGKNLAVEGPPGTGKSQTIVNAIAAALADGKKVLFVAEKLAALNVVRSRLESIGLGEFLLPLQAERSTREQVIASVRDRVEMHRPLSARNFQEQLTQYRQVRQNLADYIELLTQSFSNSGWTVHDILGQSIASAPKLEGVPSEIIERSPVGEEFLHRAGVARLRAIGERVQNAALGVVNAKPYWKKTRLTNVDRFTVEEACDLARRAAGSSRDLSQARDSLSQFGLERNEQVDVLSKLLSALRDMPCREIDDTQLHLELLKKGSVRSVLLFLEKCGSYVEAHGKYEEAFLAPLDENVAASLKLCDAIVQRASFETLDYTALDDAVRDRRRAITRLEGLNAALAPLIEVAPDAKNWSLAAFNRVRRAVVEAGREALRLRNRTITDPTNLPLLKKLIAEGRLLQGVRDNLSKLMSLGENVSTDVLGETIAVLKAAGPFSFFSSSFRRAKRTALGLFKTDRLDKSAIPGLETLATYRAREHAFSENRQAAALFGLHFRGVETDFEVFESLVRYLDFVEGLPVSAMKGFRAFLRDAEWDELENIPEIPEGISVDTAATLKDDVQRAINEIDVESQALVELHPLLKLFRDPSSIPPKRLPILIEKVDELRSLREFLEGHSEAQAILRKHFAGCRTSVEPIKDACNWAIASSSVSELVATVLNSGLSADAIAKIEEVVRLLKQRDLLISDLSKVARVDASVVFKGRSELAAADFLEAASKDMEGLFAHSALATAFEDASDAKVESLVLHTISTGRLESIPGQLEALAIRRLARAVYVKHGRELSRYPGSRLDELRSSLARQDKEIIKLMQQELRLKIHKDASPPFGNGMGRKSTWTQMALIDNEISKQRRFISVRDLTQRAGKALMELKPCWMMSPLAVAQYVPKNMVEFDLCIIDEASQMPPEAAIGALLRSKQVVVVGDTNQLPPSSFFRKMIDEEDADEDDAVLNESVLEMANATFRPARRLRWHYRSRHSGLIRFSNSLVYNDDLIVFPSATESLARMGVEFRKVDGLYKSGTNAVEAREVVNAALEFMRTDQGRSLGIVTLNQKQRDLIAEEFEFALSKDRQAQAYIEAWKEKNDGLEEFFIKNLENVQGDERDVIFIGTVYGPESAGARVAQRFGPINGLAGKRRLNVLFSRAKEKILTFSSMTSGDIVAEEGGNPGVYMLKRWLEYSALGVLDGGKTGTREPDSEFEVFVMDQIRAMGCEPVPQVGVAGYFIDIGIRHPEWPYGFILGVECDGASYHSAKSARDRDRIRQEVLERLGWRFHRIWSTDWFNNPRQEAERLRDAIARRMADLRMRESEFSIRPVVGGAPEPVVAAEVSSEKPHPLPVAVLPKPPKKVRGLGVSVGDTVRARYLTGEKSVLVITISATKSAPSEGIVHQEAPIAQALLGASVGEEVEVLSGSYVRRAVIEAIIEQGR